VGNATPDVLERLDFARRVARAAGARILEYYGESAHVLKSGGSPVTAADLDSNAYIVESIAAAWTEPVLAEESAETADRAGDDTLWVVDPLDGTREFLSRNGEFSVMIGFVARGEPIMGVVYLPARRLLYAAGSGAGAWVETEDGSRRALHCAVPDPAHLRLVGSRSHPDPLLGQMQVALRITDVAPSGSVGIKCALIAEGVRDLYIHPVPYLKEWDTCAPEVLLREAGGEVTDCRGERLRYNKAVPAQPHGIVACARSVHARVIDTIAPLYEAALRERAAKTEHQA
jgi:3'(2'), 5'-bisphosphate nucleotidase